MDNLILTGILFIATLFDLKSEKIPNALAIVGLVVGLILHLLSGKPPGLLVFLSSCALVFLSLFPVYMIRGLGAGDIKIFMMLTAYLELRQLVFIFIMSMLLGLIYGILIGPPLRSLIESFDKRELKHSPTKLQDRGKQIQVAYPKALKSLARNYKSTIRFAPFITLSYLLISSFPQIELLFNNI